MFWVGLKLIKNSHMHQESGTIFYRYRKRALLYQSFVLVVQTENKYFTLKKS